MQGEGAQKNYFAPCPPGYGSWLKARRLMFVTKTLRLSYLAFRSGGISSTLSRAALTSSLPCIRSKCSSTTLTMSGVLRPQVPVSSITAFGKGLGQDELQVWLRVIFA